MAIETSFIILTLCGRYVWPGYYIGWMLHVYYEYAVLKFH